MTHRFTDSFPRFSERRLIFEQTPELPPDLRLKGVEQKLEQVSTQQRPGKNEVLLAQVSSELQKLKEKLTPEQIEKAKKLLREKKEESDDDKEVDEKLNQIYVELDKPQVRPPAGEVSDIAEANPNVKKGPMDFMKDIFKGGSMAMIGPFIKGIIALRRQFLEFFPPKDPVAAKKQLDGIEQMYGRFFGALEVQEACTKYCKENGVALKAVPGTSDAIAYADLKVRYQGELQALLSGKNEDQKAAILSSRSFEGFIQEQIKKYVDVQKGSFVPGAEYVTTVRAIESGQKAKLVNKETKQA